MQIQNMTIAELKNRVEIGMVELSKDDVWQLLKYASESENELVDYDELKEEVKELKKNLDNALHDFEKAENDVEDLIVKKEELQNIVEDTLDFIKTLNLEDSCELDTLITTLERGMKL